MSRIHPDANNETSSGLLKNIGEGGQWDGLSNHHQCPSKLTVWKRSSMSFQGTDGFTVFDEFGRLSFRVDNYSRTGGGGGEGFVLMDGAGNALLTLRPKGLSIRNEWNAYNGDCLGREKGRKYRAFSMRKASSPSLWFLSNKRGDGEHVIDKYSDRAQVEAEVFVAGSRRPEFSIEGSFQRRNCCIKRTSTGKVVAEISRKRVNPKVVLSNEVFSLVVQPGIDNGLIMGFIVVLDRICHSHIGPLLCSC